MGKYADMLGVAPTAPDPQAGGKYARMLGVSATPEKPDVGWGEGFLRHAAQSATLGFGDEIEGAIRAIGPETYEDSVTKARARNAAAPLSSKIAGGVVGAVAVPGFGLGGAIAKGATTGARLARGAGVGAVEGAIAGFGADEGGITERLDGAALGAAIGAPLGAIGGALTRTAEKSVKSNIPLTKGQRTGDFKQLAKEETLRKTGSKTIRDFDDVQRRAIAEGAEDIVPGGGSVADEAVRASDELGSTAQSMKAAERAAYKEFAETEGFVRKDAVMDLHHRLVSALDDPQKGRTLNPTARKEAAGVLDEIRGLMSGTPDVDHVTIQQMEGVRQMINGEFGGAKGPYKAAISAIRKEYSDWMDQAITSKLYSGDAQAIPRIKNARGLASQYRQIFEKSGPGDTAGKMIQRLIGDDASPEEAINFLFGMRKLGKGGTAQALKRIEQVSPETIDHLRAAGWARMIRDRKGEIKTPQMLVNAIDEALNETPDLMRTLYGRATVKKMRSFSKELKRTITPQGAMNPSGTSYRLAEMVRGIAGPWAATLGFASGADTMGIGALLLSGGAKAKDFLTAKAAVRAARAANKKPAIAATAAVPLLTEQTVPNLTGALAP